MFGFPIQYESIEDFIEKYEDDFKFFYDKQKMSMEFKGVLVDYEELKKSDAFKTMFFLWTINNWELKNMRIDKADFVRAFTSYVKY